MQFYFNNNTKIQSENISKLKQDELVLFLFLSPLQYDRFILGFFCEETYFGNTLVMTFQKYLQILID